MNCSMNQWTCAHAKKKQQPTIWFGFGCFLEATFSSSHATSRLSSLITSCLRSDLVRRLSWTSSHWQLLTHCLDYLIPTGNSLFAVSKYLSASVALKESGLLLVFDNQLRSKSSTFFLMIYSSISLWVRIKERKKIEQKTSQRIICFNGLNRVRKQSRNLGHGWNSVLSLFPNLCLCVLSPHALGQQPDSWSRPDQ